MRSSLDYAGFAQLCGRSPIMREIMRAHNRIIPRSLVLTQQWCDCSDVTGLFEQLICRTETARVHSGRTELN